MELELGVAESVVEEEGVWSKVLLDRVVVVPRELQQQRWVELVGRMLEEVDSSELRNWIYQ